MGQQVTLNIAQAPFVDKSGASIEALLPKHIDIRNMVLTLNRNWRKRPGLSSPIYNLALPLSIPLIIPESGVGFSVMSNGDIYRLDTLVKLSTSMRGTDAGFGYRPMYEISDDKIIITDGSRPIKIVNNDSALLGGDPPDADIVVSLGGHTILMKRGTKRFDWSALSNSENWTDGDSGFTTIREDGGTIQNAIVSNQHLYIFKELDTEVWVFVGGDVQFARQESLGLDVGIGTSPHSLMKSAGPAGAIRWLGHTDDIYELVGGGVKIVSKLYDDLIKSLSIKTHIYATDHYKEGAVRFFEPFSGRCLRYDTTWEMFTEDNKWVSEDARLPIASQAYFGGRSLVGSYDPNGEIYEWGKDYLDDNGDEIRCKKHFQIVPFASGNMSRLNKLTFRLKRGVGNASVDDPVMKFRMRVDKGEWSKEMTIELGLAWEKAPTFTIYPQGVRVGREFEFEMIETDAVQYLITHIFATFQEMNR